MKLKYQNPKIEVITIQMEEDIVKSSVLPQNKNGVVEQEWDVQDTEYRTIDLNDI
ncbi:hypothetical protein [Sphingobacterium griseoflavum]|uniref:Uncharacterized protein n=1 Tax=Sphingobacterium griseoflavum TaxID=1474952 RepID=A0ABQ3I081_9SPHI|nr:hypothetical protein [Sphingobacterium griseoflavum]GHE36916.1 hypothetical protein GCM10017764_20160 [Sphingobacterium griseoflavum]